MKIYDKLKQGTEEWFKIRELKLTASHAGEIGNCGKGLDTYIKKIAQEYFSSAEKDDYKSVDMERGNELEPIARDIYELEKGVEVEQVGFIEYDEYVGCSPDGLIGKDGGWENKSLNDKTYFDYLIDDIKPIKKHIWQCQMCMKITGRKWWDLMYYNPNYKKSYKIWRIYPDQDMFDKLEKGFEIGKTKLLEIINKVK